VLLNKLAISAAKAGKRVLYYSLETSMKQLVSRMQFMISGVDSSQFRMHQWQNDEEEMQAWQKLAEAAEITRSFKDKILLRDIRPSNVSELTARVSQEMLKTQIDMIFIDYIQLLDGDRRFENRTTEMQYVCQRVKKLCTLRDGAQIPVVVAAQLSRASTKREDKKPTSEDLREGGNMEAEADKIVLIHNPPPVEKNKRNEMRSCELILSKHKDGPTGTVGCYFLPGCMRFGEYASDLYE
jgi:replicative DNA helicase